jgi:hypothetical protein
LSERAVNFLVTTGELGVVPSVIADILLVSRWFGCMIVGMIWGGFSEMALTLAW